MGETVVMAQGYALKIGESPDKDAIFDLWAFRELELELEVSNIGPNPEGLWAMVVLETSMDPKPRGSWKALGAFTPLPSGATDQRRFTGFLRYVRWQVMSNAESGIILFNLRGMAR